MFPDDDLSSGPSLECATSASEEVRSFLIKLGFLLSDRKCFSEPAWLGHIFDMFKNQLFVTEARVRKLEQFIVNILEHCNTVTARQLAAVEGQIVSMSRAIGLKVYLHTRHINFVIENRKT